ncbi:hypothetical protein ACLKMH_00670 [Psychromonas sp. KJ10-10]|uniref:hypothetical protein n=1 Tax=Psychromonas sp. KJ10-10 TaxID=3391823 RepID=UPI0039B407B5
MMRYVPFIIISLILYALFFYHSQQTVIVPSKELIQEEINTNNKIISLDLNSTTEQQITSQNIAIDNEESDKNLSSSALSEALATNQAIEDTMVPVTQPSFEESIEESIEENVQATTEIIMSVADINQPISETSDVSEVIKENIKVSPDTVKLTSRPLNQLPKLLFLKCHRLFPKHQSQQQNNPLLKNKQKHRM